MSHSALPFALLFALTGLASGPLAPEKDDDPAHGPIRRAELLLTPHASNIPPRGPISIAAHAVTTPWSETDVTWSSAPEIETESSGVTSIAPNDGGTTLDITELAKRWESDPTANHGVCLKIETTRKNAREWIYFDSRETNAAPRLRLEYEDGHAVEVACAADALLISYLAHRTFGSFRRLSVSLGDTNRVLLSFDLDAEARPSTPPETPVDDATAFEWIDFATTIEEALVRARDTNRMALVLLTPWDSRDHEWGYEGAASVGSSNTPSHPNALGRDPGYAKERAILTTMLGNPFLSALIERCFVPVRLRMHTWHFMAGGPGPFTDPLPRIGTSARDVKPPALLWISPDGKLLHKIDRMSVFSPYLIYRTCRAMLERHEDLHPTSVTDERESERARLLMLEGRFDEARRLTRTADRALDARMLALEGKLEEAEALAQKIAKSDPARADLLGEIFIRDGRFEDARRVLASVSPDAKTPAEVRDSIEFHHALADHRLRRIDEAMRRFDALVSRGTSPSFAARARMYLERGSPAPREWETLRRLDVDPWIETTEQGGHPDPIASAVRYLVSQQRPDGFFGHPTDPARLGHQDAPLSASVARTALVIDALDSALPRLGNDKTSAELAKRARTTIADASRAMEKRTDQPVKGVWDLTYALHFEVSRFDTRRGEQREAARARIDKLVASIRETEHDGGWTYTQPQRLHSFNTAPILLLLLEARECGARVPKALLDRAAAFLERSRDGKDSLFHYGTTMEHMMPSGRGGTSSCLRSPLCELALYRHRGEASTAPLERSLDIFFEHVEGARHTARIFESYVDPTVFQDSYRYFFGVYYAALAIAELSGADRATRAAMLSERVLSHQEIDGSFVDSLNTGKVSSTALALLALDAVDTDD